MPSPLDTLADPARLAVLAAAGMTGAPASAALDRLTQLAAMTLDVPTTFVTLVDDEQQRFASAVGLPAGAAADRPVPLSHSICRHVVHAGEPLIVDDARHAALVCDNPAVTDLGVRAYAGMPVVVSGHVLGAFGGIDTVPRTWSVHELGVLGRLAGAAGDVLALRTRRADGLAAHGLELSVLRHLPGAAVLGFDRDLRITLAEGAALRGCGRQAEGVRGRRLADVLPADAYGALEPRCRAILAGDESPFDHVFPAGQVWSCQGRVTRDAGGRATGATVLMRDVTEDRRRERLLSEREAQCRLLAERSTDVISRHDAAGRYAYVSPASAEVFGYAPHELVGRSPYDFVHPEDAGEVARRHGALLGRPDAAASTYRFVRADGRVIWVESTACAIRDEAGGVVELQCATRDVTARHDAEEAWRGSEALTSTIVNAMEEGLVVFGADGRFLTCNRSAERILGIRQEELGRHAGLPPAWQVRDERQRHLLPADYPVAVARRTGTPQLGVIMAIEQPDGRLTWIRANAVPLRDDAGAVERVLLSFADITDLREAERDARHRADHDALTGLANRARLRRCLDEALAAAREARRDAAVLFFDLDRFKVINDSLGHRAGDALLVAAAQRLQGELRGADVLARFGGDEFVVVAADVEGEAGAAALADRLLGVLGAPLHLGGAEHVVRASAGIALAPGGEGEAEDLLRGADLAMYRAKEEGRGRHALFDKAMLERAVAQLSLEGQLRHALAHDELELHYQPICALPGRGLAAVEALVRWRHAERGLVPPAEFIPIAEQSGLIVEIGDWVLGEACRQLAEWRRDAPGPPPMVSVNVSARQLDDPGFPSRVRACLDEHALEPRMLALEVTETLLMARPERAAMCLDALRALGVRLILDDFGTGYSSLSRLSRLPLDTFKVDRSFVAALHEPAERAIVQTIFSMAAALGLRVVAEGVETEDQLALLEELGCRLAQGYLLGRPVPPAELAVLLARPRLFEPAG